MNANSSESGVNHSGENNAQDLDGAFQPTPTLIFIAVALVIVSASIFLFRQFAPLFQQILMAVFVLYLVAPIHQWFHRRGWSKYTAYTLIFTSAIVLCCLGGFLLADGLGELRIDEQRYHRQIDRLIDDAAAVLPVIDSRKLKNTMKSSDVTNQVQEWVQSSLGSVFTMTGHMVMIGIFLIFLIIEQGALAERLKHGFGEERASSYLSAIERVNTSIQGYVAVKTFCSVIVGVLTAAILLAFGVPGAFVWGLFAFFLNYVPYVGPVVAGILPGLFAVLFLSNPWLGVLVLVLLILMQGVVGNVVDPLLLGRRLNVSPTMTLVYMVAWGSIWGITGMIISIPLLVTTQIILESFDATKPLATLLKGSVRETV